MAKYLLMTQNRQKTVVAENHLEAVKQVVNSGKFNILEVSTPGMATVACKGPRVTKYYKTTPKEVKISAGQKNAYIKVGQAMADLDLSCLDMGDSLAELVDGAGLMLGKPIDTTGLDEDLQKRLVQAYTWAASTMPKKVEQWLIGRFNDGDETFDILQSQLTYDKALDMKKTKIYQSIKILEEYARKKGLDKKIVALLQRYLTELDKNSLALLQLLPKLIYSYIFKLDSNIFGTLSNDYFTTGHKITASEKRQFKEYKPYDYVCHKDFNGGPEVPICLLFKDLGNNTFQVDFKLAREGYVSQHSVSVVGYIKDIGSITLNKSTPIEDSAQKLADCVNNIGRHVLQLAEANPELKTSLPLGASLVSL